MDIGYTYSLPVTRRTQAHLELDAGALGTAICPIDDAPDANTGDSLKVFLYTDAQSNLVATTATPTVERDKVATLKVSEVTNAGAFLDWGLDKELLLPFAEQRRPVEAGRYESVLVYLDNSGRLAATSRIDHHLADQATETNDFKPWQAVQLLIYQRTDLGFKAVIENRAIGLIYKDEVFQRVRVGELTQGYIKRIRADGRIDLSLQPRSRDVHDELSQAIVDYLHANDGVCELHDKSSPDDIYRVFNVSKKNFKKAVGSLYKAGTITIEATRIVLSDQDGH